MEITDPRAIRALAHPLRLDLLHLLGAVGPSTAAECGRVLGASQASCSFHFRQLARYGYVEETEPGRDRRERRWRTSNRRLSVRAAADDVAVRQEVERVVVEHEMQAILDYSRRPADANPEWRHNAGIVAAMVLLSPDEAARMKEQWMALLEPYTARVNDGRPTSPDRRPVRYFLAATPLPSPRLDARDRTVE